MQYIKIGLFGYGIVGHGVYSIIQNAKTLNVEVKNICVKNKEKWYQRPWESLRLTYKLSSFNVRLPCNIW